MAPPWLTSSSFAVSPPAVDAANDVDGGGGVGRARNPLAPLPPIANLTDDDILKSLDKYRPEAYFDGNRPLGGGTTDDINDLRDYYREEQKAVS